MQSKLVDQLSRLDVYQWRLVGSPTGTTTFVPNAWVGPGFLYRVVPAAIVKGNHKLPNAWSFYITKRWCDPISAQYHSWKGMAIIATDTAVGTYVRIPEGLATNHTSDLATVRSEALTKLTEEIRGKLDISIDLAQAKKTANVFQDASRCATSLVKAISQFRRMPRKFFRGTLKGSGNAWLLWTYGMKPTMQTLYDAVTESTNVLWADGITYRVKHTRKVTYGGTGTNWPDAGNWTYRDTGSGIYRHEFAVNLAVPVDSLAQKARWSSLNPVSIAWELLPWSFVADWFFNVGDYLRNMETRMVFGRYFRWGYETASWQLMFTRASSRNGANGQPFNDPTNFFNSWTGSYTAYGSERGMSRVILHAYPEIPSPKFAPQLGSGRLLNAAALLTTFLRH